MRALVTASFVTPPFLGAIAWEILAAPNSGILNRALPLADSALDQYEHLFNIYTVDGLVFAMACYTFPVRLHAGRQRARQHPGDSRTPRRSSAAGAGTRCAG